MKSGRTLKADALVIGGGITGLSLARYLALDYGIKTVLVTEEIGGLISCYRQRGFLFDFGGHVYTNKDKEIVDIMEAVGGQENIRHAIYNKRGVGDVPYPVQDHADRLGIKIEGEPQEFANQSLEQYVLRTFGPEFYTSFFRPFTQRVWTLDPAEMSCDWIVDRIKLPSEKKEGWGLNDTFRYAPGDKIAKWLANKALTQGVDIRSGHRLLALNTETKRAMFTDSLYVDYDFLFWTLPLPLLLDKSETAPFISNRVRTIGIGLDRTFLGGFTWVYPDVSVPAHRITLLSRYHKNNAPPGHDSLLLEFPYRSGYRGLPLYAADATSDDPYLRHRELDKRQAWRALDAVGLVDFDTEYEIATATIGDAAGYPIPTLAVRKAVAEAKAELIKRQIVTAGRWGSWGYFNSEHCIADAHVAAHAMADCDERPERFMSEYLMSSFYYKVYEDPKTWPRKLNPRKLRNVISNDRW